MLVSLGALTQMAPQLIVLTVFAEHIHVTNTQFMLYVTYTCHSRPHAPMLCIRWSNVSTRHSSLEVKAINIY